MGDPTQRYVRDTATDDQARAIYVRRVRLLGTMGALTFLGITIVMWFDRSPATTAEDLGWVGFVLLLAASLAQGFSAALCRFNRRMSLRDLRPS